MLLRQPLPAEDAHFVRNKETAHTLASLYPNSFLSSGYWDTYLLSSLAPVGTLRGVSLPFQYQRTPQYYDAIAQSNTVWVGNGGSDGDEKNGKYLGFFSRQVIGRMVFEPRADVAPLVIQGREFRLYQSSQHRLVYSTRIRVCPNSPVFDLPQQKVDEVLVHVEPLRSWEFALREGETTVPIVAKEGAHWVWRPGSDAQKRELVLLTSDSCANATVFGMIGFPHGTAPKALQ